MASPHKAAPTVCVEGVGLMGRCVAEGFQGTPGQITCLGAEETTMSLAAGVTIICTVVTGKTISLMASTLT